ncbi:MAG: peptide chain release factor 1 [Desulfosarcinaceae bacterium]
MFEKLKGVEDRFTQLETRLSDPQVLQDREAYQKYAKEHADLTEVVNAFREYKKLDAELDDSLALLKDNDPEIKQLAKEEVDRLNERKEALAESLKKLLIPKDPLDDKNVLLEIRAGTGGDEAGLFANDLFKMYSRYVEEQQWKIEILDYHTTGVGGLKEVIALIKGKGVYSRFKYESGTPGPGGQSVNTTDSAVRITHLPSGLVVTCQDEKSQHKNKAKAMKVLRARLLDHMIQEQNAKRSQERKSQVGSGDRSERIRTYNFPQGRVTDHRIGLTLYRLESIMQGDIGEIIQALITYHQSQALQNAEQ